MITRQRSGASLVLWTLFLATFAVGCTEMLVVGVLDLLARGLDVSVPAAGTLVTSNALGIALGGPLLTALTLRLDRRTVLVAPVGRLIRSQRPVFTGLHCVLLPGVVNDSAARRGRL